MNAAATINENERRLRVLERVEASLRDITRTVEALGVIVANEIEQERAHADDFPLSVYEEAVSCGAIDDAVRALDAQDDRRRAEEDARAAADDDRAASWEVRS